MHLYCLWLCSLAIASTGRMGLWFYVQEHPKAQPAVVLVLKGHRYIQYFKKNIVFFCLKIFFNLNKQSRP